MSDLALDWSFGGILKRYRIKREIGLREYARETGVDPANICHMEQGRHPPPASYQSLVKYCAPLKLTKEELSMLAIAAFNFHKGRLNARWKF